MSESISGGPQRPPDPTARAAANPGAPHGTPPVQGRFPRRSVSAGDAVRRTACESVYNLLARAATGAAPVAAEVEQAVDDLIEASETSGEVRAWRSR